MIFSMMRSEPVTAIGWLALQVRPAQHRRPSEAGIGSIPMTTRLMSAAYALSLALGSMAMAENAAFAQAQNVPAPPLVGPPAPEQVQPWNLPPPPPGIGEVTLFADIHDAPQGKFLEGGAFDNEGNLWFVAIGTGWVSYLTPDAKLVPVFNCNPEGDIGPACEPQGTRWHDGKLYVTTRHLGVLVYDPATKKVSSLVSTFHNQLFKGPNDLDFDAQGNLFFTDPWGTGPGPEQADMSGAVYQYSVDGILRRVISTGSFPNGIAVSPDNNTLAVADYASNRILYYSFLNGPNPACAQCAKDPSHTTFFFATSGSYNPGNGGPDGIKYDVHGNLWAAAGIGGVIEYDPRGFIVGYVPLPNGDASATNLVFGGENNQYIYMEGAVSGTFYKFKAPYPGLVGPGGVRLSEHG
jgi:gluconolactonase